ncbi:WcaF family extracellular polysaccharide biosynthesis acetyltransferase [Oscillatoria amoena NRMC-F 0135]|nr:WcaF family extracellular polysaccharide biosynthesis acetyltransferase [Oscillatoria laete-virens]MDL5047220.1 WcaF family extracellular polysaccharide biosynthesis acetyltransferase [Oscillatoria amoena NRMC-F 0135]MDL5052551.1 WcaF family extracellular polysaccharide biosynthesis acetyltransferase [Oscillatoria laete-virens NRMC-F 0139]
MRLDRFNNSQYDRGAGRIQEAFWIVMKIIFFQSAIPWPSFWKRFVLRIFGAKVGRDVVIRPRVNITMPWRLTVGDHTWIGEGSNLLLLDKIRIGSHVCISQECFLCTGSHDYRRESFDLVTAPIIVEDSVWLAARVFVAPGSHIHSGAVIRACSSVSGEVEGNALHGGNPCVKIKSLEKPV